MTQTKEIPSETLNKIEAELQRLEDTYGWKPLKTVIDAWASIEDPDPLVCHECGATFGEDDADIACTSNEDLWYAAEEAGWTCEGGWNYCPDHATAETE